MVDWPGFYKIKQVFNHPVIEDIELELMEQMNDLFEDIHLQPGSRIAITAGSRGISNIVEIYRIVVKKLKDLGYQPFLFSAMGSHGGGTVEGQRNILESLGVTQATVGCEVVSSTDVVKIGETDSGIEGLPVYVAKEAYEADGIILVNRVKAHTSFVGEHESGLVKMMAVGMGRQKGASMVHSLGAEFLASSIPAIASQIMNKAPIIGGIAVVENAREEAAIIKGVKKENIFKEDKELLIKSKSYLPRLPVTEVDFGVVLEMGKNFSGTGMDTNVIGRLRIEGIPEPTHTNIRYLAVLDLSEESHGNANGIGLADFTTERLVNKIDRQATYLNCVTSGFVIRAAIPMTYKNDMELFDTVLQVIRPENPEKLRIAIIKNTLHIEELWVSEAIYEQLIEEKRDIEKMEGPIPLNFVEGTLMV